MSNYIGLIVGNCLFHYLLTQVLSIVCRSGILPPINVWTHWGRKMTLHQACISVTGKEGIRLGNRPLTTSEWQVPCDLVFILDKRSGAFTFECSRLVEDFRALLVRKLPNSRFFVTFERIRVVEIFCRSQILSFLKNENFRILH